MSSKAIRGRHHDPVFSTANSRVEQAFTALDSALKTPLDRWPDASVMIRAHEWRDALVDIRTKTQNTSHIDKEEIKELDWWRKVAVKGFYSASAEYLDGVEVPFWRDSANRRKRAAKLKFYRKIFSRQQRLSIRRLSVRIAAMSDGPR